jgi:hypothetical protein
VTACGSARGRLGGRAHAGTVTARGRQLPTWGITSAASASRVSVDG